MLKVQQNDIKFGNRDIMISNWQPVKINPQTMLITLCEVVLLPPPKR